MLIPLNCMCVLMRQLDVMRGAVGRVLDSDASVVSMAVVEQ